MQLRDFLTRKNIPHERLAHPPAFTASRVAQSLHVAGREVAKTVVYSTDIGKVVVVLPSTHLVDASRLRAVLDTKKLELVNEDELESLFPDFERGAVPPFGSLFKLSTLVDESLTEDDTIVFEGQNHEEALRMKYEDFEELEHPQVAQFACPVRR